MYESGSDALEPGTNKEAILVLAFSFGFFIVPLVVLFIFYCCS